MTEFNIIVIVEKEDAKFALLHESDISQLSSESFNQMIDMISELFIVDPETA